MYLLDRERLREAESLAEQPAVNGAPPAAAAQPPHGDALPPANAHGELGDSRPIAPAGDHPAQAQGDAAPPPAAAQPARPGGYNWGQGGV